MITIETVMAQEFMQYQDLKFTLENGFWSVTGKNRSGKSSIVEAVLWGLFGETARGADRGIIRRGAKTAVVSVAGKNNGVDFFVGRRAFLTGTPKLLFQVDHVSRDYGTYQMTQNELEKFLGADFKTFSGSVLFGHNSFRFTRAKDSERKSLFESLIDVEKYERAREYASENARGKRMFVNSLSVSMASCKETINRLEQSIRDVDRKQVEEYDSERRLYGGQLKVANEKLKKLPRQESPEMVKLALREAESRVNALTEVARTAGLLKVCGTCGQKLNKDARLHIMGKHDADYQHWKKEFVRLKTQFPKSEEYQKLLNEQEMLQGAIRELDRLERESKKSASRVALDLELKRQRAAFRKADKELKSAYAESETYEFWTKGFSRSGVVSLLIDQTVEELNAHALDVARELTDGLVIVQFDTTTQTKSGSVQDRIALNVVLDGEVSPYENLSNSEQQRADLTVMFAWHRLVQSKGVGVNVAFFDEVMEGLDEESVQSVIRYITRTRRQLPTYLISHVQDQTLHNLLDGHYTVTRDSNGSHVSKG